MATNPQYEKRNDEMTFNYTTFTYLSTMAIRNGLLMFVVMLIRDIGCTQINKTN